MKLSGPEDQMVTIMPIGKPEKWPESGSKGNGLVTFPENSPEYKRLMREMQKADGKEKEIIIEQAREAAKQAAQNVADSLGRKFFESSVYRNLYDIVSELRKKGKLVEKVLQAGMMRGYGLGGNIESSNFDPNSAKRPNNAAIASSVDVRRFILGKYPEIGGSGWRPVETWIKKFDVLPDKWLKAIQSGFDNSWTTGLVRKNLSLPEYNETQLIFLANDIAREAINLERELNRVHLPMPGDLRDWAFRLRDLVSNQQTPHALKMVLLWEHMKKFLNWLVKIESSVKEAELRSEELKRKQQKAAEEAYTRALEKARREYEEKLKVEKEEAKKQAAKKAKKEAESEPLDSEKTYEQKQREIESKVASAVSKTEQRYEERVAKIKGELEKAKTAAKSEASEAVEGKGKSNLIPALGISGALMLLLGG